MYRIANAQLWVHDQDTALDFYTKIGAARLEEWRLHRLDGEALAAVAARATSLAK